MKKRFLSAILGIMMLITAAAPIAFAESGVEQFLPSVKARVGISDEYTDFSSNYSERNGFTEYYFGWSDDDGNSVDVGYNSDDVITSYNIYENRNGDYFDGASLPKISVSDAKDAAQAFLDKINPNIRGEFVISDSSYNRSALSGDYRFEIKRVKNGVPVNGNNGNIRINRSTGSVEGMYINYTHIDKFADISSKISADSAKKAYVEKLGLELVYMSYDDDKKIVMFPAYVEKESNKYINALTGEVYEPVDLGVYGARNAASKDTVAAESAADSGSGSRLTRVETGELEKIAGLLPQTDIEAQVRANEILAVSDDMELQSISLQRDYYDSDRYSYSMSFNDKDNNHVYVSADAKTGEITSYNNYGGEHKGELDKETVKVAADKIFNALAGSVKSEYEFVNSDVRSCNYIRRVNRIKVQNDVISINLNNDGTLQYYYRGYTNAEFPSIHGVISAADAAAKMFEAVKYEPAYYITYDGEKYTAEPVYMHNTNVKINPFTGELVNYRNEPDKGDTVYTYTDIDNHYAKTQIETLAEYGIGIEGGEFLPDKRITQRDFIYMLTKAYEPYFIYAEDDDGLYSDAKNRGWLEGINRDDAAEITRETAAILMVRMMGAERYAKLEDIYVTPFKDVTENKGYIAILYGMKVINGDDRGNFYPNNGMTRAEAACMIYNYLAR